MLLSKTLLATSLALVAVSANAVVVLDFEGVGDGASVDDFYNGGTDSLGNSGTDYGINFSSASLAITDGDTKGVPSDGNFANEPSPDTILFFLSGSQATMNVAEGFDTGFSFFYSANVSAPFVTVWDGLDGTGNMLAQLDLSLNWQNDNCTGDPTGQFCNWDPIGVTFSGTAYSVDFGGTANHVGFDEITLGSEVAGGGDTPTPPPTSVPEPGSLALIGLGLAGLISIRKRKLH